jgi:hypothetical protein
MGRHSQLVRNQRGLPPNPVRGNGEHNGVQ